MLPSIRADFALVESYRFVPGPMLETPIMALGGRSDPMVLEKDLLKWKNETAAFSLSMFDGDHFYLHSAEQRLGDTIRNALGIP